MVAQQWFVLRLMLGGGLGKMASPNSKWCDLTAMRYHYWTQPLRKCRVHIDGTARLLVLQSNPSIMRS